MRQWLIECSELGLVVSSAGELEHVLRRVYFSCVGEAAKVFFYRPRSKL